MSTIVNSITERMRSFRIGPSLAILGAAVLAAGLLQTTTASQSVACPSGTSLLAKFEFNDGNYIFEKPDGNANIVTITNAGETGGQWSSSVPVAATVIKGGEASMITLMSPPQTSGTFSNVGLPLVGQENTPAISNIKFCSPDVIATTTTTAPTTTSTVPESTTTAPTTTTPDTSTTSTVPESTTSTTSTVPESTTSTTSTVPESTTTSTVPETTTTVSVVTSTSLVTEVKGTTELPVTGVSSVPLIIAGFVLLATGLGLMGIGGSQRRKFA